MGRDRGKLGAVLAGVVVLIGVGLLYWYFSAWWRCVMGAAVAGAVGMVTAALLGSNRALARKKAFLGPMPLTSYWRGRAGLTDAMPAVTESDMDPQRAQVRIACVVLALVVVFIAGGLLHPVR